MKIGGYIVGDYVEEINQEAELNQQTYSWI